MDINITINTNDSFKKIKIDFVLLAIMILATFMRFFRLGFQSAWLDEIHTLIESSPKLTLTEFDAIIMMREGIPHFYFLCIRFFAELIGCHNIYVARLFSAVPGILSVYFIFLLGKEMVNKRVGYIAALLLSVNFFHIEYSQEGRSYAMMVLFVILSFHQLVLFLKKVKLKNAILLGLFAGLITNCHPIGLLNVAAIYLILFLALFAFETSHQRIRFFKYSFVSGIVFLMVFYPVYRIVTKVSDLKSFWIPAASYDTVKQTYIYLMGRSEIFSVAMIVFFVFFLVAALVSWIRKRKEPLVKNKIVISFLILFIWFGVEVAVILIKSFTGISLILGRYFIGILPALVLITAIAIELLHYRIAKLIVVFLIFGYSLYNIFFTINYYHLISKTQFDKVTQIILERNTDKEKVVSTYGWLMSYYLNQDPANPIALEMPFPAYITAMRNNAIDTESFWYMDGNSLPYSLSAEDEQFLSDHFTEEFRVEKYDVWARHYVLKDTAGSAISDGSNLGVKSFKPLIQDGSGNMMFFENSTSKSKEINLAAGHYELTINGNSLPAKPIKGENAHLKVKLNDKEIASYAMSEDASLKEKKISFDFASPAKAIISLEFDNDFAADGLDRNVIIYSIQLKKK